MMILQHWKKKMQSKKRVKEADLKENRIFDEKNLSNEWLLNNLISSEPQINQIHFREFLQVYLSLKVQISLRLK